MTRQISERRKAAYYIGMGLSVIGLLLFASAFVTFAVHFGDFNNSEARGKSMMIRAFGGMALIVVGSIVRGMGARGLAGSGTVLDPEQAREDLEPYSRMVGGMVKDALDEVKPGTGGKPEKIIMIKCPACGKLNEEDSKFCQECGSWPGRSSLWPRRRRIHSTPRPTDTHTGRKPTGSPSRWRNGVLLGYGIVSRPVRGGCSGGWACPDRREPRPASSRQRPQAGREIVLT